METNDIHDINMNNGFDAADIERNKSMAVLAYLGILVLVPFFSAKDSPYARFHTNQGLVLCIAAVLYSIACSIINAVVLAISWKLYFITTILSLAGIFFGVLAVIGIVNAVKGKTDDLPLIGKYRIIKEETLTSKKT